MTNTQFFTLLAAGIFQFLLVIGGEGVYRFLDSYAIVPPMLFIGTALSQRLAAGAKRQLHLCLLMALWFIIVQTHRELLGLNTPPVGFFFCAYLLALPFAAITRDGKRQKGLKAIAALHLAASLTLVSYAVLLLLDRLPGFLQDPITFQGVQLLDLSVFWDGARLWALWHPNTCANVFMIGLAISMGFFFRAKRLWSKSLLLAVSVLQFMALALTNSRTALLMTCAMIGGIVFFCIYKGGLKRFIIGILAAAPVMFGLFLVGSTLYDLHYDRLAAKYAAETAAVPAQEQTAAADLFKEAFLEHARASLETVQTAFVKTASAAGLKSSSRQGTLSEDLKTLNGRTDVWKSALYAIKKDPSLLLWGTDNTGNVISKYNSFSVWHSHNSWAEVLLGLGLPGLLFALLFTWHAVRNAFAVLFAQNDMLKKCIALLILCFMMISFMEPYLFLAHRTTPFFEFVIFLFAGYLSQWGASTECSAAE